jgi:hypothetical protein
VLSQCLAGLSDQLSDSFSDLNGIYYGFTYGLGYSAAAVVVCLSFGGLLLDRRDTLQTINTIITDRLSVRRGGRRP